MKVFCAIAAVGLGLMGAVGSASAQYYGRPDYGYRQPDYEYRERGGPRYRDRDYGYEERGPRYRGREYAFSEREYLRCNPDVLLGLRRGQVRSGWEHYQTFGRYEGRRLRC